MLPIPNRPTRPGRLTLLCLASSLILLLLSQAPFFEGPGGLALIIPWLVVLVLHLILGPVALFASWKRGPSLAAPLIYIYFLVFAGAHAWLFIHGSGLDREVQNVWRRHSNPLEAQLHATLLEFEMQKAAGVTPDPAKAAVAVQFVRRGADSNYGDLHSKPFLLRACALGLGELAMTMLQQGADARAADGSGVTPLHAAAAESSQGVVNELLRLGALPDARDAWGNTPLILAVRAGRIDNATTLLAHKPDVDAPDQNGQTPLLEAVARNDAPMARTLLQAGANANGRDLRGRSVLEFAASQANQEIAHILLEHGAVLNTPAHGHDLPLREALRKGRLKDAEALLRIGADVNATTAGGDSLLAEVAGFHVSYRAGTAGKHDLLAWLLRHGADPEGRDRRGRTPLQLASGMADEESVRLLLQAGAKP
jgi:ankyrin repeat protein